MGKKFRGETMKKYFRKMSHGEREGWRKRKKDRKTENERERE